MRDESRELIWQVTKGVVGPNEGFEFCSKYEEKQGDGKCFRGIPLTATKYLNSKKLSTVVPLYQWGIHSKNPSGCLKSQMIMNPICIMFLCILTHL